MVDIAIAANFVRELTEDQFAQQRRVRRSNAAANRTANVSAPAARPSPHTERTRLARTLGRLAQVRG
jgi:hypothetical protein